MYIDADEATILFIYFQKPEGQGLFRTIPLPFLSICEYKVRESQIKNKKTHNFE